MEGIATLFHYAPFQAVSRIGARRIRDHLDQRLFALGDNHRGLRPGHGVHDVETLILEFAGIDRFHGLNIAMAT